MAKLLTGTTFFFMLCAAWTIATAQSNNHACYNVRQKLQGLTEAVDALCSTGTATPPTAHPPPPVTWTSVPMTSIGTTNLRTPSTFSYSIPEVIPSTAREVLVYALLHTGQASQYNQHVKIFTQEGSDRYEKYLYSYGYPQNAVNTNSDNMWFPMPSNRRIMMTIPADQGAHSHAQLFAVGYR